MFTLPNIMEKKVFTYNSPCVINFLFRTERAGVTFPNFVLENEFTKGTNKPISPKLGDENSNMLITFNSIKLFNIPFFKHH